jgi:cell division septation protein DedD
VRFPALALLSLCALLPAVAGAQATLNKCIDARGDVTYSNLPCKNAREVKKVEIDPAPPAPAAAPKAAPAVTAPPPAKPAAPAKAAPSVPPSKPAPAAPAIRLEPQSGPRKPTVLAPSAGQCDILSEQLGRLLDKMDQASRKGSASPAQMKAWNEEIRELERKKQQSACF